MINEYSSLHGHSHFSVFDGLSTPEENVIAAKEKGLKSIALTDHGSCHGHADFYIAGKKHNVKTIFGTEAYVIDSLLDWRKAKDRITAEKKLRKKGLIDDVDTGEQVASSGAKELRRKGHLVLLACNRVGLSNLYRLVYRAFSDGFYGKPRMDKQMLRECREGLVASSACMGGVISKICWDMKDGHATWNDVVKEAREFDEIFGRGRFFLELQLNEHEGQKFINECMVRISSETGIPLTVTTDFHYSKQEEWEAREVLHMLDWDKTIKDMPNGKIDAEIKQLYVKSPEEMWSSYEKFGQGQIDQKTMIEAFKNTLLIDSLVDVYEPDVHQRLPTLPYPNPFEEMGRRAVEGLKRLGLSDRDEYKVRLIHELRVIRDKGMSNYFLIVQRMIEEAKKEMLVGAGRGSAAGSLVCYALGITDLDPVANDLMFERFMDPDRKELPDIDVDFEDVDATKDLLRKIFGEDNVACLSTWGTFQIKGLMKDLARVYDLDHNDINKINRLIEKELRVLYVNQDKSTIVITLDDIKRVSPSFNKFVDQYPQIGPHVEKLYNRIRHVGRHASGVVIGDDLQSETAIFRSKGIVQTSFTEGIVNKNLSTMGFVKFDILSIACLKIIRRALELVSDKTGTSYDDLKERIRPHNLNMNDQKVLKHVFCDGNFAGIFQFTNRGIRNLSQKVQPESFEDVSAIAALYRPGPLGSGMDELFVTNKRNPEGVTYDHPLLEAVLKPTRGCIIYQEQLMKVCNIMGKMTWKDVNRVRKVLLKKDKSKTAEFLKKENDELEGKFIAGCVENGYDNAKALELWNDLKYFGGYGFNVAHAKAYTVMTMQTAWLATYYPLEFYSAVLTKGQAGEMQSYVDDIRKSGIKILPVDINRSGTEHQVEEKAIRLSFASVLGVGPSAIEKIVTSQPYTDFVDFIRRSKSTKTAVSPLIKIGAFNDLFSNQGALLATYEKFTEDPKLMKKDGLDSMTDVLNEVSKIVPDMQPIEKIAYEHELLGFMVRGSPFTVLDRDKKIEKLFDGVVIEYSEFMEGDETVGMLPVVIKDFKERPQRNGKMMAFLKFGTTTGEEFESPCFSGIWKWIAPQVRKGGVYIATFNRKEDDMESLVVGRPGFAHSESSSQTYMIDIDTLE